LETIEELRTFLERTARPGVWNRVLYRGAAWALMRKDGVLPDDAPPLGDTMATDLAQHGFSLLRAALGLREKQGPSELASTGFERAANAFEALVRNGDPTDPQRGFHRTTAAAAYHLAGYSAVAYSLFNEVGDDLNINAAETALMRLVLRDLDKLRSHVRAWLLSDDHRDGALTAALASDEPDDDAAIATVLNAAVCRALAFFDFVLQTGEEGVLERAREQLTTAVHLADLSAHVPLWWICRLCLHLMNDLWTHSLHNTLPVSPPEGAAETYPEHRRTFIASLYARRTAEVELWPSQRDAAKRAADLGDDLVVALPTSAGKTRIAEIAALMTLSTKRRVLVLTPLRALSAQTERSFRKTFGPLGFQVSSLYGASGVSLGDEDALRTKDIVIATPEKLDFALRNDASLIDDVGLVVLDEGHMIGPSEREIRYETLVQRLLRRSDAADRRIVCLSAILPGGDELDDLTAWIRSDVAGAPVRSDWRPTRQRFGTLIWGGRRARLRFDAEQGGPFVDGFVEQVQAIKPEKKPYPRETKDFTLFAAWNFAQQGKRTLIFISQANWVEGYGKTAAEMHDRGYLPSLLDDPASIERALEVGREWLGAGHPAVACLSAGVAVHHGKLPSPFLRELEVLLSQGVLKVIVASPTLSQGLNLNAAGLLVPYLVRAGKPLTGEEFANVVGRAGRAFVDVEGLIVHVILKDPQWRLKDWSKLLSSMRARSLKSGLIQVIAEIIRRLSKLGVLSRDDAAEYLANSREAWLAPSEEAGTATASASDSGGEEGGEDEEEQVEQEPLAQLIERLDATVFGLVEALDADRADLPKLLDEALKGSLWARQIVREGPGQKEWQEFILQARANLIWKNTSERTRKGHFAMGVGLVAGLALDEQAAELDVLVDRADLAALSSDAEGLAEALVALAERLLTMRPFVPDKAGALRPNWRDVLKEWVAGADIGDIGTENMRMIEDAFMYRLVWALEAIRTRRVTGGWEAESPAGGAAAAVETGVPQLMMAMLIRAGLPSRRAAMKAISDGEASFVTPAEMRVWLGSKAIEELSQRDDWPTRETAALWQRFRNEVLSGAGAPWTAASWKRLLDLPAGVDAPEPGLYRVEPDVDGRTWLATPDFELIASFRKPLFDAKPSLLTARVSEDSPQVEVSRVGQGKARWPLTRSG